MNTRIAWIAAGLAIGLAPLLVAAQGEMPAKAQPAKITGKTLIAAGDMKWTPMAGLEGAQQFAVFGDPTKEAHRVIYKWAPGTKAPLHSHTHGDRGVIISGTLALGIEGSEAKKYGPGSYFSFGGGVKHSTAVDGKEPCIFYIEREGPFDVTMAEAAGAPK